MRDPVPLCLVLSLLTSSSNCDSWLCVPFLTGRLRPFPYNTGKLELPSLSQVNARGPADVPWYSAQAGQRSLLISDRLPDPHIPQSYATSTSVGTRPSRVGSFDSNSEYSHSAPSLTSASSFPSVDTGLGIKTPPSESSPGIPGHFPKEQHFMHETAYGGAMNQSQSYLDTQHAHMSTGSSYAPQSQTTGMSHYAQYPPQTTNAYAPSQPSYSHYYGGVTSPQSTGQQVSVSSQLLPLPGKC